MVPPTAVVQNVVVTTVFHEQRPLSFGFISINFALNMIPHMAKSFVIESDTTEICKGQPDFATIFVLLSNSNFAIHRN